MSILSPGTPVTAMILKFLPWTLFSVGTALLISFVVGIGLGMIAAYRRDSWLDNVLSALGSGLSAIPNYLLGIILVVFLGVQTGLLPIAAMRGSLSPGVEPGWDLDFFIDALFHAALPIATYVLTSFGGWLLTMRSSTIGTLEEDYVHVAKAKGLPDGRVLTAYVGRNAILPLVTQFTIAVGFVVSGALLIEFIFVYQGVGQLLLSAIGRRDYPVMQGVFLIITIMVIVANLLTDLLYGVIDPRIRIRGGD
jgi:peptide/nickel transport system permease protein